MLRALVLLLLLLNGTYFSWSQGYLKAWGYAPEEQREPQRLAQQIKPEAIRLLPAQEASLADAAANSAGTSCLQAGLFDDVQAKNLENALRAQLPDDSWSLQAASIPARWIIYMGKYENAEAVTRKRAELRVLNVPIDTLRNPGLEPGLSLGGFETQVAANAALNALSARGVRTARVLQERPEVKGMQLRLPAVDDGLRASLDGLKPALGGKALQNCPP